MFALAPQLSLELCSECREVGMAPSRASTPEEAISIVEQQPVDVLVLDLVLGGAPLKALRVLKHTSSVGVVIIVTDPGSLSARLNALRSGAHDYLIKPVIFSKLLERVQTLLMLDPLLRPSRTQKRLEIGSLVIDPRHQRVTNLGDEIRFTPTQILVLEVLARAQGEFVSPEVLLQTLSMGRRPISKNNLEVVVCSIRRRLRSMKESTVGISTRRGVGYCLESKSEHPDSPKTFPLETLTDSA